MDGSDIPHRCRCTVVLTTWLQRALLSNIWFLGPTPLLPLNGISISFFSLRSAVGRDQTCVGIARILHCVRPKKRKAFIARCGCGIAK